ncbi:Fic family protein [hydrothermal vent metagenome]|uniref:Fic family protein n=1 Tax=hydrothermal vent metagenome TaxID=652676 RepID=A0A1W1C1S5_9ZZZZ
MLSLATAIGEALTKLEYEEKRIITPKLRKKNRIKTIAATLEIEGNFIGEEKITALIDGKRVVGTYEEILEVEGAIKAYKAFETYRYDHLEDLLYAHKLLMHGILKNAGNFRSINVGVGNLDGVSHIAPPYDKVLTLIQDLFNWLRESDEHLLIKSCVFHYEFEFIHPFSDGNGRIGRLWQSVILYHWRKVFSVIPTESIIYAHQEAYYRALEEAGICGESTPFIEFMLEVILETIQKVGNRVGNRVGNFLTNNQKNILKEIKSNPKISAQKLSEHIGISKRKIEENIAKLKDIGLLQRVGGTRGYWEVLDEV